jgi:hypothetical protein
VGGGGGLATKSIIVDGGMPGRGLSWQKPGL